MDMSHDFWAIKAMTPTFSWKRLSKSKGKTFKKGNWLRGKPVNNPVINFSLSPAWSYLFIWASSYDPNQSSLVPKNSFTHWPFLGTRIALQFCFERKWQKWDYGLLLKDEANSNFPSLLM